MAKVTYAQIPGIKAVLDSWWNVKGLPWPFLQQLTAIAQSVDASSETFNKFRKKFIDEYAAKDKDGNPIVNEDGTLTLDDSEVADIEWASMIMVEFDCPTLRSCDVEANAERLGLTLGTLRTIKPVIEEVIIES